MKETNLNICDAHHHLWNLEAVNYPWLSAPKGTARFFGDPTKIQKNYLVKDFKSDVGQLPVTQSVHVQVGAAPDEHIKEIAWIQSQIDSRSLSKVKLPSAIVAYADLESDNITGTLDNIQAYKSVRGIRQIVGREPSEDEQTGSAKLLTDKNWLFGLQELQKRSLSFDLQLIPSQMNRAFEVFSLVQDLPVALCHCGSPWFLKSQYRSSQSYGIWKDGITKLASLPNIYCKVSGLSMFTQQWNIKDISFIFETILETFGIERCMFGSNFPVDKLHIDYQSIWKTYMFLTEKLKITDRKKLFADNCRQFYKL